MRYLPSQTPGFGRLSLRFHFMQRFVASRLASRAVSRSCWARQYARRYTTAAPPPPSPPRTIPRGKRVVICTVAFLAGLSFYFVLPDPSRSAPTLEREPLSPRYFTSTTVIENDQAGPDTKLLRLAVKPEILKATDPEGLKAIWSVFIKDDDIQVERPYTPLYGIDEHGHMVFWIKKYPKGEVGRWLHAKQPGDKIELRAPLATWQWKDDTWDEVVMVSRPAVVPMTADLKAKQISGGTGFAPFYQLFHSVISNMTVSPQTQFKLLHSSRRPEELPPPSLIKSLLKFSEENPQRLKVDLFVDEDENKTSEYPLAVTRINEGEIKRSLGLVGNPSSLLKNVFGKKEPEAAPKRRLFLVCGPEPYVLLVFRRYVSI